MTEALDNLAIIVAAFVGLYSLLFFLMWMFEEKSRAARLVSRSVFGLLCAAVAGVLLRGALRVAGLL